MADLGRVTTAYVSGYQRDRVHRSSLMSGEIRPLVANFNGIIDPLRTIASVTWRTNQPWGAKMSNGVIDGREVMVTLEAQGSWCSTVKCSVTLDNGERYNQVFEITSRLTTWYFEDQPWTSGPREIVVTA